MCLSLLLFKWKWRRRTPVVLCAKGAEEGEGTRERESTRRKGCETICPREERAEKREGAAGKENKDFAVEVRRKTFYVKETVILIILRMISEDMTFRWRMHLNEHLLQFLVSTP